MSPPLGSTPDLLCTCHEQTPAFVQHHRRQLWSKHHSRPLWSKHHGRPLWSELHSRPLCWSEHHSSQRHSRPLWSELQSGVVRSKPIAASNHMMFISSNCVGGVGPSPQDVVEYSCAWRMETVSSSCKGAIRAGNLLLLCKAVSP